MSDDPTDKSADGASAGTDFIRAIIAEDLATAKHTHIVTRFPPHPNGYLHIGHSKAFLLDFGVATENGGTCTLRFDDTNPVAEKEQFIQAIQEDIRWLGCEWNQLRFASDYFDPLYAFAVQLVERGKAFVCQLSSDEIFQRRGSLTEPGIESPHRDRPIAENLELLRRMKDGEFDDGSHTLRAKIDMGSAVLTMRDPVMYRILKHVEHHRTGRSWSIYPMYDFAHGLSDAVEGVTHSLCSLEFVDHRPLYDWYLDHVDLSDYSRPRQIEFARLKLSHTVTSKRVLKTLVEAGRVSDWDDPRMPTLAGMRRRGYTPAAIRNFISGIGVARRENIIQLARLEHEVRADLNQTAMRVLGVLNPLRVVITNYPESNNGESNDGGTELLDAINNPEDASMGSRQLPFSRVLYIEREDFMEDPPRKFFRLAPGREVRLRYAYFITCVDVVKDEDGEVVELHCTYDPATRGGDAPDGRKVKGTLHWVSAEHAVAAEVRLYQPLFTVEDPAAIDEDLTEYLNSSSLTTLKSCWVEPSLASASPGDRFQFERLGYFCVDPDTRSGQLVLNRTVTLRDSWAKVAKQQKAQSKRLS